jgi:hypothetical protein
MEKTKRNRRACSTRSDNVVIYLSDCTPFVRIIGNDKSGWTMQYTHHRSFKHKFNDVIEAITGAYTLHEDSQRQLRAMAREYCAVKDSGWDCLGR